MAVNVKLYIILYSEHDILNIFVTPISMNIFRVIIRFHFTSFVGIYFLLLITFSSDALLLKSYICVWQEVEMPLPRLIILIRNLAENVQNL
jgi:hypothetical protein